MYTATIVIGTVFAILIIMCIIWYIIERDNIAILFLAIFTVISLLVVPVSYTSDKREANYPYDKIYTVKLYYQDGGHTINRFTCKGWETPWMQPHYGSYSFMLGDNKVPCVTRYDIIKVEKHNRK